MKNPFTLGLVTERDSFCNRGKEQKDLMRYAMSGSKVILCSPRRYGKSSLVHVVLSKLRKEGFLTAYVDLFPISSERDFISRFASSVYKGIGNEVDPRTFIEKIKGIFTRIVPTIDIGPDGYSISAKYNSSEKAELLLDDLMEGLEKYVDRTSRRACIVLDEFQEITELPESKKIEGILRSHMQHHQNISYFYVGSRRRILTDMFSSRSRPFYKSAFFYTLNEIPIEDFAPHIVRLFKKTGKRCPDSLSEEIYRLTRGYPYYVQKLSSIAWEETEKDCDAPIVKRAFDILLQNEAVDFEGTWGGLSMAQKRVLKSIASESGILPFSKDNLEKSEVSAGGVQKALKSLLEKDLIEKNDGGLYSITDPIMGAWLKG